MHHIASAPPTRAITRRRRASLYQWMFFSASCETLKLVDADLGGLIHLIEAVDL
jgi:hypothetical protein